MSQPSEGARVSYIGQAATGPELGAQGHLLAITGSGGHVKWDGGRLNGQLTFTAMSDIVSVSSAPGPGSFTSGDGLAEVAKSADRDDLDDSLEFGHTAAIEPDDDMLWDGGW